MKKDKHILINIEETYYKDIERLAAKEDRNITNMTYLLIKFALATLEGNKSNV